MKMLEFAKKILLSVSFDRDLFKKELKKAVRLIEKKELLTFYTWCIITFGDRYKDLIIAVFTEENILG